MPPTATAFAWPQHPLSDRLVEVQVRSDALVGTEGVRVLLPAGYDPESPVRYLLHGGLGGFRDSTDAGGASGRWLRRLT